MYSLYQRDRPDAAEPLALLWYNTNTAGDWWYNLALDHHFSYEADAWVSMRSSWTDSNGLYVAMKAGNLTGHQTVSHCLSAMAMTGSKLRMTLIACSMVISTLVISSLRPLDRDGQASYAKTITLHLNILHLKLKMLLDGHTIGI